MNVAPHTVLGTNTGRPAGRNGAFASGEHAATGLDAPHLQRAINAADLAGLTHYAAGLRQLYQRQYGFETVTGAHFRRAIDWARTAPRLRDQIGPPVSSVPSVVKNSVHSVQ